MLHTVLYPDSCSAPPWITLTPHLLLQLLLNFRSERLKRLLLEQTSFGISGLWWCSSPFSHPAVITGSVLSQLPVGERHEGQFDSATLISPSWPLPSLSWAQQPLLLPQLPSPAHLKEKQFKRSQWEPCKRQRSMVVCHPPWQPTSCRLLLPLTVIHSQSQSLPNPRPKASCWSCWFCLLRPTTAILPTFPVLPPSLQSSSALILYCDNHSSQPISHK